MITLGTFYVFRMYVFRKYFSEKINYFHFLKCYSVFFQKIIMPFLTFLKKYTSSFQKNISTFFNTQIVKMVKIAVMVSSYAELQFDISEEINFKFQKNISSFFSDGQELYTSLLSLGPSVPLSVSEIFEKAVSPVFLATARSSIPHFSVCVSVCLSVCLSVRPNAIFFWTERAFDLRFFASFFDDENR